MASKSSGRFGLGPPFDPSLKLVTSHFISPFALAAIRLTFAVYSVAAILFDIIYQGVVTHTDSSFFSYFTELSYIGICAYFWASGVQTLAYARSLRRHYHPSHSDSASSYPLQRWPQFLQFLHVWLTSTVLTFPIVVTIVFWALLSSPTTLDTPYHRWHNITIHMMNCIFILFEFIFGRTTPWVWMLLPFNILILAGYLGVAYITHATQGFYTYSFLNPQKEKGFLAVYIVGIAVGEAIVFAVVWALCWVRDRLFGKQVYDFEGQDDLGKEMVGTV